MTARPRGLVPLLASLAVSLAAVLAAQPPKTATPSPEASPPAATGGDTIKNILDAELEPPPGGYTYSSQGRRDPFVSLLRQVDADLSGKTRRPGMEGFLIQEVALKGIVKTPGGGLGAAEKPGYIALMLGTDGRSYPVREGQRLFDGVVTSINATTVKFRQDVTDPLSPVRTREIIKTLYPSEEARQ
jgi:Tfp pilus assembly protein PilP